MSPERLQWNDQAQRARLEELVSSGPWLVEVRFPRSGTSPDWYLLEEREEFDFLMQRLAPGAELGVTSVWEINGNHCRAVIVR